MFLVGNCIFGTHAKAQRSLTSFRTGCPQSWLPAFVVKQRVSAPHDEKGCGYLVLLVFKNA